jgi:hypothetical protein
MNSLAALQDSFQRYVLHGQAEVEASVAPSARGDRMRRLALYRDGYRLRLIEALAADYEGLQALMGEEAFRAACLAYVEATPSAFRNVRWYGAGLADFLAAQLPWLQSPALAELARFEWELTLAFDAPDARAVTFEQMAALPPHAWSSLALELHPSVRLLALRSNAAEIRRAHSAQRPLPESVLVDDPRDWLIWRRELEPYFLSLPPAEGWALRAAQDGATFPELCEGLCRWTQRQDAPAQAAALLRGWVDRQLIGAVRCADQ